MNERVWVALCLLFCAFNLKLLADDYSQLNFKIVEKDDSLYDKENNYSLCILFHDIKLNNELIYEADQPRKVSASYFLTQTVLSIEKKINRSGLFKAVEGTILDYFACFPITKLTLEHDSSLELLFYYYAFTLHIHSEGKKLDFKDGSYLDYTKAEDSRRKISLRIQKQKVYGKEVLLSSDCHTVSGQLARNSFTCLNDCFHRFNFEPRAYSYDDSLHEFDLALIANNSASIEKVNSSSGNQDSTVCLQECPERDCFYEMFYKVTVRKVYHDAISRDNANASRFRLQTSIYQPYYSTPKWESWLQFFGIFTLFTNTSIISVVTFLVLLLAKKLNLDNHRYFGIAFPKFKIFILVFCLLLASVLSGLMISDFCFKLAYPNQTSALTFSSKFNPFSVVVCFPVELLIENKSEIDPGRNEKILEDYSFDELKNNSGDVLGMAMIWADLYLGHKIKPFELKDKLSEKVLFRSMTCNDSTCLARCFLFKINLTETRYESLLPTNLLDFGFRTKHWRAYLVDDEQPFTTSTYSFVGEFYFRKYQKENLWSSRKSNCKNYAKAIRSTCQTRMHCFDQCMVNGYIERYQKLPLFSIVDMDALDSTSQQLKFTNLSDSDLEKQCHGEHHKEDCLIVLFYESMQTAFYYRETSLNINLNFETFFVKEIEQSAVKLVLNILNLESIFFGSNLTTLLLGLVEFLKRRYRFTWYRFYRFLIFLVCLAGFTLHIISIFYGIVKDPLTKIGYFEKIDNLFLPNQIFCFPLDESKIDPNVKLTGSYLDKVTNDELNFKKIFNAF